MLSWSKTPLCFLFLLQVKSLCVSVLDSNVLVQRNTLEVILFFFPFYTALVRGLFWYCHMHTLCRTVSSVKSSCYLCYCQMSEFCTFKINDQILQFLVPPSILIVEETLLLLRLLRASNEDVLSQWILREFGNVFGSIQAWETAYGKNIKLLFQMGFQHFELSALNEDASIKD